MPKGNRAPMKRTPVRASLHPTVKQETLVSVETAADMVMNAGRILAPALGPQWTTRTLKLYREIMHYQQLAIQRLQSGTYTYDDPRSAKII